MRLVRVGHGIPNLCSARISPFIINIGSDNEHDIVSRYGQENLIADAVKRLIFVPIDLNFMVFLALSIICC